MFLPLTLNIFQIFSSVFNAVFEQVNVSWEGPFHENMFFETPNTAHEKDLHVIYKYVDA